MCFGGGGGQPAYQEIDPAQEVLDRESVRQNNVNLGKANIDTNFKQFDDKYYDTYKSTYQGNYVPQVDEQYKTAVGKMMTQLAKRGMDRSSVGVARQGELADDYVKAKTTIASEADTAANTLRSNVEASKSNLYALNSSSADPAAAAAQAAGQAKTLVAPPQYSPIGDVFASALQPFNSMQSAQNNTSTRSPYASPYKASGKGSATVVK